MAWSRRLVVFKMGVVGFGVAGIGKLGGRGTVAWWKLVVVVGFSHGGPACPSGNPRFSWEKCFLN